jgi:hypothetical protein
MIFRGALDQYFYLILKIYLPMLEAPATSKSNCLTFTCQV